MKKVVCILAVATLLFPNNVFASGSQDDFIEAVVQGLSEREERSSGYNADYEATLTIEEKKGLWQSFIEPEIKAIEPYLDVTFDDERFNELAHICAEFDVLNVKFVFDNLNEKFPRACKNFNAFSNISYMAMLIHHQIIFQLERCLFVPPSWLKATALFALVLIVTAAVSEIKTEVAKIAAAFEPEPNPDFEVSTWWSGNKER